MDVCTQVSLLSEGGRAELTHVRPLAGVLGHVHLQRPLLVERLGTHRASEWPLPFNASQSNQCLSTYVYIYIYI